MEIQPPAQKRGGAPFPIFGPFLLWPNGWMHRDATWYGDRPQPRRLCVRWRPSPLPQGGGRSPFPIFGPCLLWPNGWMDQDGSWRGGGPWSNPHCAGDLPYLEKGEPRFSAHFYCGQKVGCIKMALGMEVGLSPGDFVLDGDSALLSQKGQSPQFSVHVYCGQTSRCIKMPLGMEVGLSPGDFVLDGDPAPSPKGETKPLPNFWPMSIVAKRLDGSRWQLAWRWALVQSTCAGDPTPLPRKGEPPIFGHFHCGQTAECINMPLGIEVGLSSGDFVLDEDPALVPRKGRSPPMFGPCLL